LFFPSIFGNEFEKLFMRWLLFYTLSGLITPASLLNIGNAEVFEQANVNASGVRRSICPIPKAGITWNVI
tara:strand:+ start:326 stop:535 length:210 start_codon:yes stop_codon:yes gene_type:complete